MLQCSFLFALIVSSLNSPNRKEKLKVQNASPFIGGRGALRKIIQKKKKKKTCKMNMHLCAHTTEKSKTCKK